MSAKIRKLICCVSVLALVLSFSIGASARSDVNYLNARWFYNVGQDVSNPIILSDRSSQRIPFDNLFTNFLTTSDYNIQLGFNLSNPDIFIPSGSKVFCKFNFHLNTGISSSDAPPSDWGPNYITVRPFGNTNAGTFAYSSGLGSLSDYGLFPLEYSKYFFDTSNELNLYRGQWSFTFATQTLQDLHGFSMNFAFRVPYIITWYNQITDFYFVTPDGEIVDMIGSATDNVIANQNQNTSQIIQNQNQNADNIMNGYNDSVIGGANNNLSGAIGSLDQQQSQADQDLNDALSDLSSPDLSSQSQSISFVTSSMTMFWDNLGAFRIVLFTSFSLIVFNFISRYRGS